MFLIAEAVRLLYQSTIVERECEQVLHVFVIALEDQIAIFQLMRDEIQATPCFNQHKVDGDTADVANPLVEQGDDDDCGVTVIFRYHIHQVENYL